MKTLKYTFFSLVILGFLGYEAHSQELYGITHLGRDGQSTLHIIDKASGAATPIGPVGFERCGSMDFDAQGTLYAICERADIAILVKINISTGAGTEIGPTNNCEAWTDMSFRNGDGTLFATGYNFDPMSPCTETVGLVQNWLTTINTLTGESTLINIINQPQGGGNAAAFSQDDTLYYLVGEFNTPGINVLFTVDQQTGEVTTIANPTYPGLIPDDNPRTNAMDFDQSSGLLYLSIVNGSGNQMTRRNFIGMMEDVNSGEITIIGPTEEGMDAIAIRTISRNVPTLSEWGLIAMAAFLGIIGFMVAKRRQITA